MQEKDAKFILSHKILWLGIYRFGVPYVLRFKGDNVGDKKQM